MRVLSLLFTVAACQGSPSGAPPGADPPSEDEAVETPAAPAFDVRRVRRLSHVEYRRTIADLLGVDLDVDLPADPHVDGFRNDADALRVSELLVERYRDTAEALAFEHLHDLAVVVPCDLEAAAGPCLDETVRDFGYRAFRRPLREDERDAYVDLGLAVAADDGIEAGVRWVIAAMLQSPHFLYRPELGRFDDVGYTLTDHEAASVLSYLVWSSMPDEALLTRAAEGRLRTSDEVDAALDRLLDAPRADGLLARFTDLWLDLDGVQHAFRDPDLFPVLDDALREALLASIHATVDAAFKRDDRLDALLAGSDGWTAPALAAAYGFPAGEGAADLSATPYVGLLAHPAVQLAHAHPTEGSPVHRGRLVRERVLCEALPPPPPGVDATLPPSEPGATLRERLASHREDPSCSVCHDAMDPIGHGFDGFDAIGRAHGDPDVFGEVVGIDGTDVAFVGPADLAAVLAGSAQVHRCFARHWIQHGLGVNGGLRDRLVDAVSPALEDGGVRSLVRAVAHVALATARSDDAGAADTIEPMEPPAPLEPDDVEMPPEPETPDLTSQLLVQSDWGAGYCADVFLRNHGDAPILWEDVRRVDGTLTNVWNAEHEPVGDDTRFTGVAWNEVVDPGGEVSFGFCAER